MSYADERRTFAEPTPPTDLSRYRRHYDEHGLTGDQADDLRLLDAERRARATGATGRSVFASGMPPAGPPSELAGSRPDYGRAGPALGCGLLALAVVALVAFAWSALSPSPVPSTPPAANCGAYVRDVATQTAEQNERTRRTLLAVSSPFVPIPSPTMTAWEYDGPYGAGVTPPEYQERSNGEVRNAVGGRPR